MSGMADGFSAEWLRLREPFDLAARSQALALGFRAALHASLQAATRTASHAIPRTASSTARERQSAQASSGLRLIDLAAGTGANFRALAPVLAADQSWLLIDHDPFLLAAQRSEIAHWAARHGWHCDARGDALSIDTGGARWEVRGQCLDLARALEDIDLHACDGLVTTAFLDLVSAEWLARLSVMLREVPRPLLATLTVDGCRSWHPPLPSDNWIAQAFRAHQGGDKGFGPSLGAQAASCLANLLSKEGYEVSTQASDWRIGPGRAAHGASPEEAHIQAMLTGLARESRDVILETLSHAEFDHDPRRELGVASAAKATLGAPAIAADWFAMRAAQAQEGLLSLEVGHLDLLAVPRPMLRP